MIAHQYSRNQANSHRPEVRLFCREFSNHPSNCWCYRFLWEWFERFCSPQWTKPVSWDFACRILQCIRMCRVVWVNVFGKMQTTANQCPDQIELSGWKYLALKFSIPRNTLCTIRHQIRGSAIVKYATLHIATIYNPKTTLNSNPLTPNPSPTLNLTHILPYRTPRCRMQKCHLLICPQTQIQHIPPTPTNMALPRGVRMIRDIFTMWIMASRKNTRSIFDPRIVSFNCSMYLQIVLRSDAEIRTLINVGSLSSYQLNSFTAWNKPERVHLDECKL